MESVVITTNVSGTTDEEDRRAMKQAGERVLLSDLKPLWVAATDVKRASAIAALQ